MADNKEFFSTSELAHLLGVSRIAVFKKIRTGSIHAQKVGRNYVISRNEVGAAIGAFVSPHRKEEIDASVKRTVLEYGDALKRLSKE